MEFEVRRIEVQTVVSGVMVAGHVFVWEGSEFAIHKGVGTLTSREWGVTHIKTGLRIPGVSVGEDGHATRPIIHRTYHAFLKRVAEIDKENEAKGKKSFIELMRYAEKNIVNARQESVVCKMSGVA